MDEIGLFISTFGGSGLFIVYLINKDKTSTQEQLRVTKANGQKIDKQAESTDDLSFLFLELLDNLIPNYGNKRTVRALKTRIEDRQYARAKEHENE